MSAFLKDCSKAVAHLGKELGVKKKPTAFTLGKKKTLIPQKADSQAAMKLRTIRTVSLSTTAVADTVAAACAKPGVGNETLTAALEVLCRIGAIGRANRVHTELKERGVQLSAKSYQQIIERGKYAARDAPFLKEIEAEMINSGIEHNNRTLTKFVSVMTKAGDIQTASEKGSLYETFDDMSIQDWTAYLGTAVTVDELIDILTRLLSDTKVVIDDGVHSQVFRRLCHVSNSPASMAEEIHTKIFKSATLGHTAQNALMRCYLASNEHQKLEALYNSMPKHTTESHCCLIDSYRERTSTFGDTYFLAAEEVFQKMSRSKERDVVFIYLAILRLYAKLGSVKSADLLTDQMTINGIPQTREIKETLQQVLESGGYPKSTIKAPVDPDRLLASLLQ
eukprot:TRINITY_DN12702_c0_g1_i1.p1 TRINITY_DN12702_c0_g1~~TRINITY_DN12702_c0_g1_i1.p1  ORF type:complete len:394 (+),score=71.00 TRINITY_DN12702_c0_g1_i1:165-1346(+)